MKAYKMEYAVRYYPMTEALLCRRCFRAGRECGMPVMTSDGPGYLRSCEQCGLSLGVLKSENGS
jgi:hypothetical protein